MPSVSGYAVEIEYYLDEGRPNGRSEGAVQCPACETAVVVRLWSFGGSGKKCPTCGSILYLKRRR